MDPADLESALDAALKRLPPAAAPPTLLPRVMAAVEARRRPWYARAWFTWPAAWQAAALAVLVLAVAGGSLLVVPAADSTIATAVQASAAGEAIGNVAASVEQVQQTVAAARVIWRTLLQPVVVYVFVLALVMCLACAGLAIVLNHIVLGRAVHR